MATFHVIEHLHIVEQEVKSQVVAPMRPATREALISEAVNYISENPERVAGRVVGNVAISVGVNAVTKGSDKVQRLQGAARTTAEQGALAGSLAIIGTSGDVREAVQQGVTDPRQLTRALVGGEIDDEQEE